ncbi:hypothetical protein [Pontibacter sp. G13]|uniref:hypothetical protein n=1 Tax=Pontibacter sp. G13 TaxID=3074898 RepID=UPI00288945C7|nr:hypothetical protein [Pontibacter sp. G13]WNJ18682.1 hypothetical protein RJD25_27820 [Pontibacter sp. G13]
MASPSTQRLNLLFPPAQFQSLCRSISALEAIISPEWVDRYYSYQNDWSESEEFFEMRNGAGDYVMVCFRPEGIVINGFAHESKRDDLVAGMGMMTGLPPFFHEFMFEEPVKTIGSTFCIWALKDENEWTIGNVAFPDGPFGDGSQLLLSVFDGLPESYRNWALDYYDELEGLDLELVASIYRFEPITVDLALALNPDLDDWESLSKDLDSIGYPYQNLY